MRVITILGRYLGLVPDYYSSFNPAPIPKIIFYDMCQDGDDIRFISSSEARTVESA